MSLLEALILGLIQGLTEFLPISSSAHLRVVPAMAGWQDPGAAFTAVAQLGATIPIGALGLAFEDTIEEDARNLSLIVLRPRAADRRPDRRAGA